MRLPWVSPPSSLCKVTSEQAPRNLLIEKLLRTGTLQMALFDQELAEVLTEEGIRYVLRRNPMRAQEVRDIRHAKLATLRAHVAKQNQYLTDHPRANAQGALQKLMVKAEKLRIVDWVELTLEERVLTPVSYTHLTLPTKA